MSASSGASGSSKAEGEFGKKADKDLDTNPTLNLQLPRPAKPADKGAARPADKPADKLAAKPADKPADKPAAAEAFERGAAGRVRSARAKARARFFDAREARVRPVRARAKPAPGSPAP